MNSKSSRQLYRMMRKDKLGSDGHKRTTGMHLSAGSGRGAAEAAAQVNYELEQLFAESNWHTRVWLWWDWLWFQQ